MSYPEPGDTVACEVLTIDGKEYEEREVADVDEDRVYFHNGEHQQHFVRKEAFDVGLWEIVGPA